MISNLISFSFSVLLWVFVIVCIIFILALVWYFFVYREIKSSDKKIKDLRNDTYHRVNGLRKYVKENQRELRRALQEIGYLQKEIANLKRAQANSAPDRGGVRKTQESQAIKEQQHFSGPMDASPDPTDVGEADRVEVLTPVEKLVADFNPAIRDRSEKDAFEAEYKPRRLSVSNAMERQVDPEAAPVFESDGSGTYWLVEVDKQSLLLPFPTMVVKDRHRESGAVDTAFTCSDYARGTLYEVEHLQAPAILERSMGGRQWKIARAGRMKLTPYS